MNSLDSFEESGKLNLKFSSIELALLLADYIFESQLYYFGKLVSDSLEGAQRVGQVMRLTKNMEAFNSLPKEFTVQDVSKALDCQVKRSANLCSDWYKQGVIERIDRGKYRKLIKILEK